MKIWTLPNTTFLRWYLPGDSIIGHWVTNRHDLASRYGIVSKLSTNREIKILVISDPTVVIFLRNLFIKYISETNSKINVGIFDSVIKSRKDGTTERNSTYIGDTYVLKALLYERANGWLSQNIDGFGADELPTDTPTLMNHYEICLFEPVKVLHSPKILVILDDPKMELRIRTLRINRKAAIKKNKRKQEKRETFSEKISPFKRKGNLFETSFLLNDNSPCASDNDYKENCPKNTVTKKLF
jgi:hypothetical protein